MPFTDLPNFAEIKETFPENKPDILLGNGFSRSLDNCFAYEDLLTAANFGERDQQYRTLFERLNTSDFEHVVKGIQEAKLISQSIIQGVDTEAFDSAATTISDGLRDALVNNHIPRCDDVDAAKLTACKHWFDLFNHVFTTNFDLLLYWVSAKTSLNLGYNNQLKDGFGTDEHQAGLITHPSTNTGRQNLFYMHGAMHLFKKKAATEKLHYNNGGAIRDQIDDRINESRFPLIVIGGSSAQKMSAIGSSPYLSHCYRKFCKAATHLVTFGIQFSDPDRHILDRIRQSRTLTRVFIGVFQESDLPEASRVKAHLEASRDPLPELQIQLYNSSTVTPWEYVNQDPNQ